MSSAWRFQSVVEMAERALVRPAIGVGAGAGGQSGTEEQIPE